MFIDLIQTNYKRLLHLAMVDNRKVGLRGQIAVLNLRTLYVRYNIGISNIVHLFQSFIRGMEFLRK